MPEANLTDAEVDDESTWLRPPRRYAGSALAAYHQAQNADSLAREAESRERQAAFDATAPQREAAAKERRAGLVRHHAAKRRAARLRRTPPWADQKAIRAIYERARRLTVESGVEHHVDHIIPLQGERVSGLHVENNLQVLTGSENSRKRNLFEAS